MDNVININNLKDSTIEFDVETDGFDKNVDLSVRLVVSANPVVFAFDCEKEGNKWICKIPAMAYVTPSAYPFTIEVVADGYFFQALQGILNITKTKDVYVQIPKSAKMIEPPTTSPKEEEEEVKKNKPIKIDRFTFGIDKQATPKNNSDIENIAKKLMADAGKKEEEPEKKKAKTEKTNEASTHVSRTEAIEEILNSVLANKRPKSKFSIRDKLGN